MAFKLFDLIRETTTTAGTGALALGGALKPGQTWASRYSVGDTCWYRVSHTLLNEWETGLGTYSAAHTLTRTAIFQSTNADAAVAFSAGTKIVEVVRPSDFFDGETLKVPGDFVVDCPALQIGLTCEQITVGNADFSTDDVEILGQSVQTIAASITISSASIFIGDGGSTSVITIQGLPTIYSGKLKMHGATPRVQLVDSTTANTGGKVQFDGGFYVVSRCNDDESSEVNLLVINRTSGLMTVGMGYVVVSLGVGTDSPDCAFTVVHPSGYGKVASFYSNATDEAVGIGCESSGTAWVGTTTNHGFALRTAGVNRLTVGNTGNVALVADLLVPGNITSQWAVNVTKDGSDTIGGGALLQVANAVGNRSWVLQLSGSNNLDFWYYDGASWVIKKTLTTAGAWV